MRSPTTRPCSRRGAVFHDACAQGDTTTRLACRARGRPQALEGPGRSDRRSVSRDGGFGLARRTVLRRRAAMARVGCGRRSAAPSRSGRRLPGEMRPVSRSRDRSWRRRLHHETADGGIRLGARSVRRLGALRLSGRRRNRRRCSGRRRHRARGRVGSDVGLGCCVVCHRRLRGRDRRRSLFGLGSRSRCRPRRRRASWRQEPERVDVALLVARYAHPQMDIRLRNLRVSSRTDGADDGTLRDRRPFRDDGRAEMRERDDVPVGRRDRHDQAARGHRPDERDATLGSRANLRAPRAADVDPAVLAGGVWIRADSERSQHLAVCGPRPRTGARGHEQPDRADDRANPSTPRPPVPSPPHRRLLSLGQCESHAVVSSLVIYLDNRVLTIAEPEDVVNFAYSEAS